MTGFLQLNSTRKRCFLQRSLKREHVIIKWILKVTHKNKDMSIDFADWIKDGRVLSQ
jgi:hypothetical protein